MIFTFSCALLPYNCHTVAEINIPAPPLLYEVRNDVAIPGVAKPTLCAPKSCIECTYTPTALSNKNLA